MILPFFRSSACRRALLWLMLLLPVSAPGQAARDWDIPPGALAQTLNRFGHEAGILLAFSPAAVAGKHSQGVRGHFTVIGALAQLLADSGLVMQQSGPDSFQVLPAESSAHLLQPVQVQAAGRARPEDEVYRTAGSRTRLTREHVERFRGTSVGDMFQGVPGVLVGENRNSGGLDINIRGMQGQGRVPVLVDGARQETTVYRGYSGVASRSYIDPDLIGGVDIIKGPSMSAQGTGAVGGLVSMRTISANDILLDDHDWGVRLRGSAISNHTASAAPVGTSAGYEVGGELFETAYRTNCQYDCSRDNPLPDPLASPEGMDRPGLLDFRGWAGSIAAARRFEAVDLVLAYAQRQQGNYYAGKNGPSASIDLSEQVERGFWTDVYPQLKGATRFRAGERIVNTEYASRSALLKGSFWLPGEQNLELSAVRYESEYGEIMPSMLIRFGRALQAPSSTVDANTWAARYTWQPTGDDRFDVSANLWHTDTRSRNVSYPDDMVEMNDQVALMMGTELYKRWGADLSNTMRFDLAGEWQWRYGAAWQLEDVRPKDEPAPDAETFLRDGERKEVSAFTALQWKPWHWLTLDAGIRYSDFSADDRTPPFIPDEDSSQCIDLDGDGACDQLSVHHTASNGSAPLASVTWEPLDGLQFYALYAEALRMPSLFESTRGFSATQAFDVAVRPEHAYNRELGINLLRTDVLVEHAVLGMKLAYFRNTVRDYLTRTSPNLWEESANLNQLFTLRNIDKASFHGYELSLEYDAGLVFGSVGGTRYHHIEVCHHGSYRRYDCTDYGLANSYINNMIPPNWHASATLGTRLMKMRLTLGARGTFMGERNAPPEYQDDTHRGLNQVVPWHDYTLVDLFASYRPNKHLSFDFNIDNLTDQYYLDALSLGLVPAPGRTARVGFTLQL